MDVNGHERREMPQPFPVAALVVGPLGAGHSRRVMGVAICMQWGLFLPVAYLLGPGLGYGLLIIWSANVAYRVVQALVFVWSWHQGHWARIRI